MALMPFLALGLWTRGKVALKGGDISTPTGHFRLLMNMYTTKRTGILFHFDADLLVAPYYGDFPVIRGFGENAPYSLRIMGTFLQTPVLQ